MTDSGEPACFNLPLESFVTVYLALGTNIGDRRANLEEALRRIDGIAPVQVTSSVYETEPVGFTDQPDFWNLVARASTDLPALQLMQELIRIEVAMGRERTFRNAPRLIDIDLLLYDDVRMNTGDLDLPHPRMHERAFVLRPLLEIAPDLEQPGTRVRYAEYLKKAADARVAAVAPPLRLVHETN